MEHPTSEHTDHYITESAHGVGKRADRLQSAAFQRAPDTAYAANVAYKARLDVSTL